MIFFFFSLNDRDAQEETPIWIRQHSGPVTKNGPSFISWAWVCSRPIINYLISTLFNQRSSGMSGQRASPDFTAIDFICSRRGEEMRFSNRSHNDIRDIRLGEEVETERQKRGGG